MRSVVHWDGDSFFASIEQAADRRLRGRPVAVGGARRGVVVSASLEARRFGIRPGLAMRRARRMCRSLVVLPGHFELYERFSSQIIDLCEETTPLVEPVAVGAAYLDLTGTPAASSRRSGVSRGAVCGARFGTGCGCRFRRASRPTRRWRASPPGCASRARSLWCRRAGKPSSWPRWRWAGFPEWAARLRSTLEVAGIATVGDLARAPIDDLALVPAAAHSGCSAARKAWTRSPCGPNRRRIRAGGRQPNSPRTSGRSRVCWRC